MKRNRIIIPTALLLLTAVGCGNTTDPISSSAGLDASAPPAASSSATPAGDDSAEERFVNTTEDGVSFTNNIPLNGVSKNEKGEYAQTTVRQDQDYMKFDSVTITDATQKALKDGKITGKEIEKAQQKLMLFVAEEALDSELNGGRGVDSWMKQQDKILHPDFKSSISKDLQSTKDGKWDGGTFLVRDVADGYTYFYDREHGRLTSRDMELTTVDWTESGDYEGLVFTVRFSRAMPAQNDAKDVITYSTSGTLTYSMLRAGEDWKLGPWKNTYETKEFQD